MLGVGKKPKIHKNYGNQERRTGNDRHYRVALYYVWPSCRITVFGDTKKKRIKNKCIKKNNDNNYYRYLIVFYYYKYPQKYIILHNIYIIRIGK